MTVLSKPESTELVKQFSSDLHDVRIPSEYTAIGDGAFREADLKGIWIPGSVKTIGEYAFYYSDLQTDGYNIKPVKFLEDGLISIGRDAFHGTKIRYIDLPDTLEIIGSGAFKQTEVIEITLSSSLREIGDNAFENTFLANIEIPDNVESIGEWAFSGSNLVSVDLGDGLKEIKDHAFSGNVRTSRNRLTGGIKELKLSRSLTSIGRRAFASSNINISLSLPAKLETLGVEAFSNNNIQNVFIPSNLKIIPEGAFKNNKRLSRLDISEGVERIEDYAFYQTYLPYGGNRYPNPIAARLEIPDSVTYIGEYAFAETTLKEISINEKTTFSGTSFDEDVNIVYRTIPSAPTSLYFTDIDFKENTPIGTSVLTLNTEDSNISDQHVYRLVGGEGSADNQFFGIDGNKLIVNKPLDYETKSEYEIRIRTMDPDEGLGFTKTFVLKLEDIEEISTNNQNEEMKIDTNQIKEEIEVIKSPINLSASNSTITRNESNDLKSDPDNNSTKKISVIELKEVVEFSGNRITNKIVGTQKKDKIIGTSSSEIISGGLGKNKLTGGKGSDGFMFENTNEFGKKKADKITDFNKDEGDAIILDRETFSLGKKIKLKIIEGKKKLKKSSKSGKDFVYEESKGQLYFNENGREKGWGEGGLFALLEESPILNATDFVIL